MVVLASKSALRAFFAQHVVLRRCELGAPFGVAFLNLVGHAQSLFLRGPATREFGSSSATTRRPGVPQIPVLHRVPRALARFLEAASSTSVRRPSISVRPSAMTVSISLADRG